MPSSCTAFPSCIKFCLSPTRYSSLLTTAAENMPGNAMSSWRNFDCASSRIYSAYWSLWVLNKPEVLFLQIYVYIFEICLCRCSVRVSVVLPYSQPDSQPLVVATWTAQRGITLTSNVSLFPEKFDRLVFWGSLSLGKDTWLLWTEWYDNLRVHQTMPGTSISVAFKNNNLLKCCGEIPTVAWVSKSSPVTRFPRQTRVTVAMEQSHLHKVVMEVDPSAPGKKRISFQGYLIKVLDYIAQGINFT